MILTKFCISPSCHNKKVTKNALCSIKIKNSNVGGKQLEIIFSYQSKMQVAFSLLSPSLSSLSVAILYPESSLLFFRMGALQEFTKIDDFSADAGCSDGSSFV